MPDSAPRGSLPEDSCLIIELRPDIQCGPGLTCINPLAASAVITDPKYDSQGVINFQLTVPGNTKADSYILSFVLNVGWCGNEEQEWIRSGDYLSNKAMRYNLGFAKVDDANAELVKYTPSDASTDGDDDGDNEDGNNGGAGNVGMSLQFPICRLLAWKPHFKKFNFKNFNDLLGYCFRLFC